MPFSVWAFAMHRLKPFRAGVWGSRKKPQLSLASFGAVSLPTTVLGGDGENKKPFGGSSREVLLLLAKPPTKGSDGTAPRPRKLTSIQEKLNAPEKNVKYPLARGIGCDGMFKLRVK